MATLNYEKDAVGVDVFDLDGNLLASFFPEFFPGIPGTGAHADNFALEAVGFLELTAGVHTFGVSVTADRTDVNDDDGYQVFVAPNPRDYFGLKVGEYERIAPGFQANWRNENQFTVEAPVAGIYPFRILYWQTGHGANLQVLHRGHQPPANASWSTTSPTPSAIKAYRDTSVAAAEGPVRCRGRARSPAPTATPPPHPSKPSSWTVPPPSATAGRQAVPERRRGHAPVAHQGR